jgi:enoyl-CoA hydratase
MNYEFYLIEKKPPIAWVFLNRPEKKNAMNAPAWKELMPITKELDADDSIRAIIIAGKGSMFCAGIDLVAMVPASSSQTGAVHAGGAKLEFYHEILKMQDGLSCLEQCRKPVIAAVHGKCIGAGLDLITACDVRLCSEDAEFNLKEAAVGFVADMGVLQRIVPIVGHGIARELAFTAKFFPAQRAKEILLVNEVFKNQEALMKGAEKMAMEISANSPLGVKATKVVLNRMRQDVVNESLAFNAALSAAIVPSDDLMEAAAAFVEKRKPVFTGK